MEHIARSERAHAEIRLGVDACPSEEPLIHVVDDDDEVLQMTRRLIESVGYDVETHRSARAFLRAYRPGRPGCLLLDVRMPDISGLELQEKLNGHAAVLPIIFVTGHADTQSAVRAMKRGAFDFLEKPYNNQSLLELVLKATEASRRAVEASTHREQVRQQLDRLTPREREVLKQIVTGKMNKQIAHDLAISERTVEVHRARVMEKLDVRTLAELVRKVVVLDVAA